MSRPPLATPEYETARRIVAGIVQDLGSRRGMGILGGLPPDIRFRILRAWRSLAAAEVAARFASLRAEYQLAHARVCRERDAAQKNSDHYFALADALRKEAATAPFELAALKAAGRALIVGLLDSTREARIPPCDALDCNAPSLRHLDRRWHLCDEHADEDEGRDGHHWVDLEYAPALRALAALVTGSAALPAPPASCGATSEQIVPAGYPPAAPLVCRLPAGSHDWHEAADGSSWNHDDRPALVKP